MKKWSKPIVETIKANELREVIQAFARSGGCSGGYGR